MKSTAEQLRKRGMADQFYIDELMNLSYDELIDRINAKSPAKRTHVNQIIKAEAERSIKLIINGNGKEELQ